MGLQRNLNESAKNGASIWRLNMKESLRDKTRDDLTFALNAAGVGSEMSDRGRVEEKVENSWYQRSLGVIDISEGAIKWINILKKDRSDKSPPKWWVVMGIPDDGVALNTEQIKIKTKRKKSFPLFGKVIGVTWKGKDGSTGLAKTLSDDLSTDEVAARVGNLEIKSQIEHFRGWTLTVDRKVNLTNMDWEAFKKIADYILTSPR